MEEGVIYNKTGVVAEIIVNRPKAYNALNPEIFKRFFECIDEALADEELRGIIITGAGEKAFIAGGDIGEIFEGLTAETGRNWYNENSKKLRAMETSDKIVIAAINGLCLGGGAEIAMSCDFRLASENANFGFPEVTLGIVAGVGGTSKLVRYTGSRATAKELLLTGDAINAEEAYRIGLFNHIYKQEDLLPEAYKLINKIAKNAPLSVKQIKRLINQGDNMSLEGVLAHEVESSAILFGSEDFKEGRAAFMERRKPNYQGK
jgi:enoyl-CoA hydratase